MPRSRILAAAAATSAIALATLLIASPAHAATLPEGQRITVVDDLAGDVYQANPATAALSLIGPGILLEGEYVSAVEVADDGLGYALVTTASPGDWGSSVVIPVDANTGTAGTPVNVSIPSVGALGFGCSALDLRDGVYYTSCFTGDGEDGWLTHFGTLSPVTGVLDVLLTFEEEILFTAFASNPVTGQFWAFEYRGSDEFSGMWVVNPADWTFTADDALEQPVWSADFDRDGQLFVSTEVVNGQDVFPQLSVLDPDGGVFSPVGLYTVDGAGLPQRQQPPLTVWGAAPALPATGHAVEYLPVGVGAALLLLAGGALVLTRRIDRRA